VSMAMQAINIAAGDEVESRRLIPGEGWSGWRVLRGAVLSVENGIARVRYNWRTVDVDARTGQERASVHYWTRKKAMPL